MNRSSLSTLVAVTMVSAFFFSQARLNSQGTEPIQKSPQELLKALKASNAQLLIKQQERLKKLDDLKVEAEQLRIFSKRT